MFDASGGWGAPTAGKGASAGFLRGDSVPTPLRQRSLRDRFTSYVARVQADAQCPHLPEWIRWRRSPRQVRQGAEVQLIVHH